LQIQKVGLRTSWTRQSGGSASGGGGGVSGVAGSGASSSGGVGTAGGSGGTVAILSRRDAGPVVARVAEKYASETGYQPYIFSGSSPGSAEFGHLRLAKCG